MFRIPVAVSKYSGITKVAPEVVPPYEPLVCTTPPSERKLVVWVYVPRYACDPEVIEKLVVIVCAAWNLTLPAILLKTSVLTVEGRPLPVYCVAAAPL